MKSFVLLTLVLCFSAFAGTREEAAALLTKYASETDTVTRMDLYSRSFLGRPYGHGGPLGEGPSGRYDQDPLFRFDTFDCTTFVETIVSLALSRDVDAFEKQMNDIRYHNGDVDFLKRNHFTDLEWIPFNVQNGLLKEINRDIVPASEIEVATAEINFPAWIRKISLDQIQVPLASREEKQALLEELHGQANQFPVTNASVEYISISTLLKKPHLLKSIPNGTIVNFVRPNWDLTQQIGTHQNISHQAFLFWKGSVLTQRHASTLGDETVSEIPFIDYLKKFENHPTLKGVHLMRVNI